ncbi:MAG TPA: SDR family oxidoreductase [Anseongella sp.]|nr:SDR family oxidoreductase [Anseongella sp.]
MEQQLFSGKTAIVTGAGQGIGFEICRQLSSLGAGVVLNDIDPDLARSAAKSISAENGTCIAMPGDVSDIDFIRQLTAETSASFGKIDILIANAGITLFGSFLDYTVEKFRKVVDLNLQGSFFLAQSAAREMRRQKTEGSILLMSSVTGHRAHDQLSAYGMTKAALELMAKTLVIELSPYRITINSVAPGATLTERTSSDPNYESVWSAITPMGQPATPADIAHAAVFLVSPQARHITGQNLVIDGGWTCISPPPNLFT